MRAATTRRGISAAPPSGELAAAVGLPHPLLDEHAARSPPNEGSMTRVNTRKIRRGKRRKQEFPPPRETVIVYASSTTTEGRPASRPRQGTFQPAENGSEGADTDAQQSQAEFHRDSPFAFDYWNSPGPGATRDYITPF